MRYEQIQLADAASQFETIAEIVTAVRETKGLPPTDAMAALESFAKRGDTAALAWEGDRLIGCVCLGACHHFITDPDWVPLKVRMIRDGIDLAKVGCTHFVYLHPDYWGQGLTLALTDQVRRSNPKFTHTLLHGFATKELEDWAAGLDGAVEVGSRRRQAVFLRSISRAS
ncbi:GNAT family N-acetyltransferase [Pseudophaeobacter sp. TrK17]|uniref:GNAT family N-acetyltransferase n=1 Tax=Pseudophaeobacter sp. TrK17 TaxID=2815167 RepID=UPI0035CF25B8